MGSSDRTSQLLVAILNVKADLARARDELWYRVPVEAAPRRWPPDWIAFYQTRVFESDKFAIRHYGRVRNIEIVRRRELFPAEFENEKSDRLYYKANLERFQTLDRPIISRRGRRLVFVPTTLSKFERATEINDLFDDSPLEDDVWAELKRLNIRAERQWFTQIGDEKFMLDFAVFCRERKLDIETDGDSWHADKSRIALDNQRNNTLEADRWHILRFNGRQVREQMSSYVLPKIAEAITKYGGQEDEELAAPKLGRAHGGGIVNQPTLLPPNNPLNFSGSVEESEQLTED